MRLLAPILLLTLATLLTAADDAPAAARILAWTKTLSADEFEGRAPGTRGEDRTVGYLEQEFRKLGLKPGNPDGTYVQKVPLAGITSRASLGFRIGATEMPLTPVNDFVGLSTRITTKVEGKASEVVFVGYGITAPEFHWDDYKGADLRGKTVLMLINDPPVTNERGELDPAVFGGRAMTYYGRWTYKYEIAAKLGAAACLIIHETGPAAYPFGVVVSSWGRENFELRAADNNAGHVALSGWLTLDAAQRLIRSTGRDLAELKRAAARRDFRPVPLGATADFTVENALRMVDSRNVVALVPGSDPERKTEHVIYNAHWDHLGVDERLAGDRIFNGAADNAAGVAMLLEIARAFSSGPAPRRSVLFLSVTAEEKGLLGARHYARQPLHPLEKALGVINMDGANQFGPTRDIEIVGLGSTTMDAIATELAGTQGRTVRAESNPERGTYFRSDHFEFAKVGVPGFYAKAGRDFIGQPPDFAERKVNEYIARHYHQPSDEVKPDWTFGGAAQDAALLTELGRRVASGDRWPEWSPGSPFRDRREQMLKGRR